jgi:hypothetical protein
MLRFRLRTLLIAVALLATGLAGFVAWRNWSREWIRLRAAMIGSEFLGNAYIDRKGTYFDPTFTRAPCCLWVFGGVGYANLYWTGPNDVPDDIRALYPETTFHRVDPIERPNGYLPVPEPLPTNE